MQVTFEQYFYQLLHSVNLFGASFCYMSFFHYVEEDLYQMKLYKFNYLSIGINGHSN